MRTFHKLNAILLVVFIFFHLANHLSGMLGIVVYDNVQSTFRLVYRQPLIEFVLLASITLQLLVGAKLLIKSLRRRRPVGFWPWAQHLSGGVFFLFMVQHLFSFVMSRWYFDLDTTFYWPASVMSGPPFIYYFVPYYFLGVFAVIAHVGVAVRYALMRHKRVAIANKMGIGIMLLGAIVSAAILPVISGAYFAIDLPPLWIDYLRWYVPNFEPW
jgi:succinate dehydrogenase/fumarate reductase cytochrome b subunit